MSAAALRAGLAYFGCVFATGFALGAIRVPVLVPAIGERAAELAEMPFMLVAIVLAARWTVRRFSVPPAARERLGMGVLACALVLACDLTLVLWLRGLTLEAAVRERDPVSGTVYLLMLLVFALMPLLVRRRAAA